MTIVLLLAGLALSQEHEARLTEVKGEVTFYGAEQPEGLPAEKDAPIVAGDRIVTGPDSYAELALDAEHVIYLRENTDFTLTQTRKDSAELTLTLGSLLAKVRKLVSGESLKVRTPTAVAAVRGTEFAVESAGDETHVAVYDEGKLEVSGSGASETLLANQETAVMRGRPPLPAYYLRRLERHRRLMRGRLRARPAAIRKAWRSLPPAERQQLRRKAIERMIENRRKRAERRLERGPGRGPVHDRRKQQAEKDRERRERIKEQIRRRGGRPQ